MEDEIRVEQALYQLQGTKRLLEESCEAAKAAVRSSMSQQIDALGAREAWLLHQVDLHRSERLETIQRHQEALRASVGQNPDRLNQLLSCRLETPFLTFRAESACLREVISQYGRVACGYPGHFADEALPHSRSLPRAVEDYDEDLEPIEHKSVSSDPAWVVRMPSNRPGLPLRLRISASDGEKMPVADDVSNWLINSGERSVAGSESYEILSNSNAESVVPNTPVFNYFSHIQATPLADWLKTGSGCCRQTEDCGSVVEIESLSRLRCASTGSSKSLTMPPDADSTGVQLQQHFRQVAASQSHQWLMNSMEVDEDKDKVETEPTDPLVAGVCRANELCKSFNECCLGSSGTANCCQLLTAGATKLGKDSANEWLLKQESEHVVAPSEVFKAFRDIMSTRQEEWLIQSQPSVNKNSPAITSAQYGLPPLLQNQSTNFEKWLAAPVEEKAKETMETDTPNTVDEKLWLSRYVQVLLTELPEHEADVPIDKWLLKRTA